MDNHSPSESNEPYAPSEKLGARELRKRLAVLQEEHRRAYADALIGARFILSQETHSELGSSLYFCRSTRRISELAEVLKCELQAPEFLDKPEMEHFASCTICQQVILRILDPNVCTSIANRFYCIVHGYFCIAGDSPDEIERRCSGTWARLAGTEDPELQAFLMLGLLEALVKQDDPALGRRCVVTMFETAAREGADDSLLRRAWSRSAGRMPLNDILDPREWPASLLGRLPAWLWSEFVLSLTSYGNEAWEPVVVSWPLRGAIRRGAVINNAVIDSASIVGTESYDFFVDGKLDSALREYKDKLGVV